LITKASFFG